MARCAAITRGGSRCKLEATHGSYCWSHAPETAEARKQRARRGGQAGGNGRAGGVASVQQIRREVRAVIGGVLNDKIERRRAAVVFQGFNVLLRAVEVERRLVEQEDLERRIERLEELREEEDRWAG